LETPVDYFTGREAQEALSYNSRKNKKEAL
jgi:hypothetical protein